MTWITPKIDWTSSYDEDENYTGDYFNIDDYNRIKNNIDELKTMAIELYPDFDIDDMGDDKTYTDYPYSDEINLLTSNLELIKDNTFEIDIGTRVIYYDNSKFIDYTDLNRIETACLNLYNTLTAQSVSRRRLAFYLGRKERF